MDALVSWRPDGFRVEVAPRADGNVPMGVLAALYGLCLPAVGAALVEPALVALMGTLLLPLPSALGWSLLRPRGSTVIDVDHQRLVVRGPLGRRRVIPIRAIRGVSVRLDGLEVELSRGQRVAVAVPASLARLSWLSARLVELAEEVRAFEADVDGRRGEGAQLLALAQARRGPR